MTNTDSDCIDGRALASGIAVGIMGALTIWIVPGFVRLIAEHARLDVHQVGYVASWDINSMAASIGLTTFLLPRVSWRVLAALGLGLIAVGSLCTAGAHAYVSVIEARVIVGVGEGVCVGVAFAAFGRARTPSRAFAVYMISGASISAGILLLLPTLQAWIGSNLIFVAIAALACVASIGVRWFPSGASNTQGAANDLPAINWRLAAASLGAVFLYFFAQGAIWSYFARIGEAGGIDPAVISRALAAGTLAGIAGAFAAGMLPSRLGRGWPIVSSGAVSILSFLLLPGHVTGGALIVSAVLLVMAWNFSQPLLSGLCCDADRRGRVVCAMGCIQTIGFGLGPSAAAALFDGRDISPVVWMCTAALIASLTVLLVGMRGRSPSLQTGRGVVSMPPS